MKQPPDFVNAKFPDHVVKLVKDLYGLKLLPKLGIKDDQIVIKQQIYNGKS